MDQDPPRLTASLALNLIAAGREAQRRIEQALAPHGLTLRHLGALGHLARRPDLSYSDLARRAGITAQSMHATVRLLQDAGAVADAPVERGKKARLEVTPRGRELLDEVAAALERIDAELLDGLTAEQQAAVRQFVRSFTPVP
ncbi:hypothetical protein A4R43_06120 [Amycolatopsis albispora]|uniref:HTH marR-type domain-containing protein n=2 Tax=Amycolatopsis albispora TaxID=1804986 RepID=A0A344L287_9PSEU|nr:hypothetical protein A4R43_06120 [Amycolatopsis albispora]